MNIPALKDQLKKYRIDIHCRKDFLILNARKTEKPYSQKFKELLYSLLNHYENRSFILIKGIPPCLLPEAQDHVNYEPHRNTPTIKPETCHQCKYTASCPGIEKRLLDSSAKTLPIFNLPQDIVFELNKSCNLNCAFCFHRNKKRAHETLSLNEIQRILDEAKRLRIAYVRFTGGEPLLHKNIFQILRLAKSKGFYVFLNTNATLLNDRTIKKLETSVDNVLVSLCGYNDRTEQIFTSKGRLLKNKFSNILKLKHSKIPYVRLGSVVTKLLLENFDKYTLLVKALGIRVWEFYRPMTPPERGLPPRMQTIEKEDILKLLRLLRPLKDFGINATIANPVPFCITDNAHDRPFFRGAQFDDGHSRLVFDARGFFKPSYSIELNLGKAIREAWHHPYIQKLNSCAYLPGQCQRCVYLRWCMGGSRYMAHEHSGDYFAADPWMNT